MPEALFVIVTLIPNGSKQCLGVVPYLPTGAGGNAGLCRSSDTEQVGLAHARPCMTVNPACSSSCTSQGALKRALGLEKVSRRWYGTGDHGATLSVQARGGRGAGGSAPANSPHVFRGKITSGVFLALDQTGFGLNPMSFRPKALNALNTNMVGNQSQCENSRARVRATQQGNKATVFSTSCKDSDGG